MPIAERRVARSGRVPGRRSLLPLHLLPSKLFHASISLCFFLFWPIMYIRDGQIHNFYSVDVDDALCVLYAIMSRGNLYEIIYSVAYTDGF